MAFASYATIGDVTQAFQVTMESAEFVEPAPVAIHDYVRSELDFAQRRVGLSYSEFAVCENLIYPILKEVWKNYLTEFDLWSHIPLNYNEELSGTPDYFLAKRSILGSSLVVGKPYLLVVEAKRDDFNRGWGQCLAAMLAAQKLNNVDDMALYGITTNGMTWQFGKLQGQHFTLDFRPFSLADLDRVCAATNFLFQQCRHQLAAYAGAA